MKVPYANFRRFAAKSGYHSINVLWAIAKRRSDCSKDVAMITAFCRESMIRRQSQSRCSLFIVQQLSYRRGTARRAMSVEILSTAAYICITKNRIWNWLAVIAIGNWPSTSVKVISLTLFYSPRITSYTYVYVYSSRRQKNRPTAKIKTNRQTDKQTLRLVPQHHSNAQNIKRRRIT